MATKLIKTTCHFISRLGVAGTPPNTRFTPIVVTVLWLCRDSMAKLLLIEESVYWDSRFQKVSP